MYKSFLSRLSLLAATALLATACGGGGNDNVNFGSLHTSVQQEPEPIKAYRAPTIKDIEDAKARERDYPARVDRGPEEGLFGAVKKGARIQKPGDAASNIGGEFAGVINWPINPIHLTVTPDGKVMNYGTDQAGAQGAQLWYDVWDYRTGAHTLLQHQTKTDIFCNAQMVMPTTGQILLAGGDTRGTNGQYPINGGVRDTNVFDPGLMELMDTGTPMTYARWYGTLVPMGDGRALVMAGTNETSAGGGPPEVYTPGKGWDPLDKVGSWQTDYLYPRAFLGPKGDAIVVGFDGVFSIDIAAEKMTRIGTLPTATNWTLPFAMYDTGKAMMLVEDGSAVLLDVNGPTPVMTKVQGPSGGRIFATLTLLADGKLFLNGGSMIDQDLGSATYSTQIWDPKTQIWTTGATADKPRLYHSSSILLPDATVLTGGGGSPGPVINLNAEVYSPPYLFNAAGERKPRPMINNGPAEVPLGGKFDFTIASAKPIARMTMVRTGATTHSLDFGQRFLDLPFTQNGTTVTSTIEYEPNVLPIGYYMVFAFDTDGTPSVSKIVNVTGAYTKIADQGQTITLPKQSTVRYGIGDKWVTKTATTFSCTNSFFNANPMPTVNKTCEVLAPAAAAAVVTGVTNYDKSIGGEGTTFGEQVVSFGLDTRWVTKRGPGTCSADFFIEDPAFMTAKGCVADGSLGTAPPPPVTEPPPPVVVPPVVPPVTPPPTGVQTTVASEDQAFTVPANTVVRYGADTRWVTKTVTGTATCSNAFFGSDPAPFTAKSCTVGGTTTPPPPVTDKTLAQEGQVFTVAAGTVVQYGADTRWITKTVSGTGSCTNEFFGSDPAPFTVKTCVSTTGTLTKPPVTGPAPGTVLAVEGQTFMLGTTTSVQYGADTRWITRTLIGQVTCSNAFFGGDPAFATAKVCRAA